MPLVFCGVCPHPPIMVPEVGRGEADKVADSRRAMLEFGRRLKDSGAQTLVVISPHGPVFRDGVAVNGSPRLKGDLGQFGAPGVKFDLENDLHLAGEIVRAAGEAGITALLLDDKKAGRYGVDLDLDHGVMVPLYFLREAGVRLPLVSIGMSLLPRPRLYTFGTALARAVDRAGRKVALIASGDLSHRLIPGAPAGYEPQGREFDRQVVDLVGRADAAGILDINADLAERAGECGLRSLIMALGALDGLSVQGEVLSYEGPFGVGYMVAVFNPGATDSRRRLLDRLSAGQGRLEKQRLSGGSFLVQVARKSLTAYFTGNRLSIPEEEIPPEFTRPAGAFVSLHKHGQLRGCIGTISPQQRRVVDEVVANAVSAAIHDPRFYPVTEDELPELEISVDVLQEPEPVSGPEQLDPKKYGVIVRAGHRSGLLLPDLEGVDDVAQQVAIARQKAGIGPREPVELQRFEVKRYH
ncbi:AmmeMemoRadiSam system protein A [Desulfotomaculum copahuensis]|uniref:AmmeMemoRadiSam system protein A n=1 Tax=Desulfotomaculum copahuensis TaxID=1838280 RepID=A0A1B7LD24_9FIRM|nr:AmmeMemoRadiSam system protein A [Desulfotomaculum copahuensis]OAT80775.1 AmmeMemoRadiSam system protein A [Desulfotomaculum copahuensis]